MKLITVSGPPSSGKTSVIVKTIESINELKQKVGVVKFDCLSTFDNLTYKKKGIEVRVGISGGLCPDHFFVTNVEECITWGINQGFDILISESAGLCNRCSPHIKEVLAVCVIDNLSGINTPQKIGPMLRYADIVVVTKGEIVSQAEREVFTFKIKQVNPKAVIIHINGITGQGSSELAKLIINAFDVERLESKSLRFTMPSALCSYCLGETKIGTDFQLGNVKKMEL
ncbi:MAG: GTP-binding protein [Bacillota bacterium]|nr:GTP-binding protein [Bacillota bacterium]